jgi:hypothetical protein
MGKRKTLGAKEIFERGGVFPEKWEGMAGNRGGKEVRACGKGQENSSRPLSVFQRRRTMDATP